MALPLPRSRSCSSSPSSNVSTRTRSLEEDGLRPLFSRAVRGRGTCCEGSKRRRRGSCIARANTLQALHLPLKQIRCPCRLFFHRRCLLRTRSRRCPPKRSSELLLSVLICARVCLPSRSSCAACNTAVAVVASTSPTSFKPKTCFQPSAIRLPHQRAGTLPFAQASAHRNLKPELPNHPMRAVSLTHRPHHPPPISLWKQTP